MQNPVPSELSEAMSPSWLTEALSTRFPNIKVTSATETWRLQTVATKVRLNLAYSGNVPAGTPRDIFVKGYFGPHMKQYVDTGAATTEVRFFADLSDKTGVRTPSCFYAAVDEPASHAVMILEDIAAKDTKFLSPLAPYTVEDAEGSLDQLARLHASHWGGRDFNRYPWLKSYVAQFAKKPILSDADLQKLSDGRGSLPIPDDIRNATRINRSLGALCEHIRNKPECLLHGDTHLGNFFQSGAGPGLYDWQLLQTGCWATDVGYHIGAALSESDRERSEQGLLKYYLDRLAQHGATPPPWEEAWTDYRVGILWGYYLWVITRFVVPEVTREFNIRLGSAVAAHDSFKLLGV